MFRRLYEWMLHAAQHKAAPWILGGIAVIESSVFPIAPDVMLVPMCIARRDRALAYGAITTAGSVIGGILGYGIGAFLFEQIGRPLLHLYGYEAQFARFAATYNEQGVWIVLAAGFTPLPYKIFTIASGLTGMNFYAFMLASVAARGARFMGEAWIAGRYGPSIAAFVTRYAGWVSVGLFALLFGGFALIRFVF